MLRLTGMYGMVNWLRELYESDAPRGIYFRYGLILFDLAVTLFLVVSSFLPGTFLTERLRCGIRTRHFVPPNSMSNVRSCGMSRRDAESVHCKHRGRIVKIPHEGTE